MSEVVDFATLLKRHLEALAAADDVCRQAADKRRAVLKTAASDGLSVPLLKLVAKEQHLDPEVREELEEYRLALVDFSRTPLGAAAQASVPQAEEDELVS
jgi:hypothetical protein